ncbi:MAG: hypothetical protein IPM60_05555 [Rhodospirillales bacterium]|nr:hypothetical protein [Rhodospirillales bacterium]
MNIRLRLGAAVVALPLLAGCADMTDTQQRTLTGGAGGAAGGAVIGALAGNAAMGAAIGGAAGLAGGFLWDQHKQTEERAFRQGYETGRKQGG